MDVELLAIPTIYLFTIAAYYFLAKYTTTSFIISVILGIVHTQINGNAVYIFMLGALIPFYQGRYKMTLIYCSIGIITGLLFYRGMPTVVGLAGYSWHDLITSKPEAIYGSVGGFLGGSFYQFTPNNLIIGIFGLVMFLIFALILVMFIILILKHIFKKTFLNNANSESVLLKYDEVFRQQIIMILMAGSLLLTAVGVAISRGIFQNGVMLVERYFLYSVISIGITYLLAVMLTEGRVRMLIGIIALPLSLIFCVHSYYVALPQVVYFEKSHEADIYNLKHHRTTNNKMFGFTKETLVLFEKTLNRKIYNFPMSRFDTLETKLNQCIINQKNLLPSFKFHQTNEIIKVYAGVKVLHFDCENFNLSQSSMDNTFFIVLKNEANNEIYLIAPFRFIALRKDFLFHNQLFGHAFSFIIQQDSVKKGHYRIGMLIFENNKTDLRFTSDIVNIDNTQMIDYLQHFGFYQ